MKPLFVLLAFCGVLGSALPIFAATDRKVLPNAIAPTYIGGALHRTGTVTRQVLTEDELAAVQPVHFVLKLRNFAELQARIQRGDVISLDEMAARYFPTHETWAKAAAWAQAQGMIVKSEDTSRLTVFASSSVAGIQTAFRLRFARVVGTDGNEYTSAITAPSIPADLADSIVGVLKLQPHLRPIRHQSTITPTQIGGYISPTTVAQLYNASGLTLNGKTLDGTGQTIVILGEDQVNLSDLAAFRSNCGLPAFAPTQFTEYDPSPSSLGSNRNALEETMDIEWSGAMAPGASILYFTSLDPEVLASWLFAQNSPNQINQVSASFGLSEAFTGQNSNTSQYFAAMTAVGVTFFNATGDYGSTTSASVNESAYDPNGILAPGYPATDPYVTGVGGTTVIFARNPSNGAPQLPVTEGGWCLPNNQPVSADRGDDASTGGNSLFFSRPAWQTGTGVPVGSMRCSPDVAAMATGNFPAYVFFRSTAYGGGGTSQSSPTWAGLCALINQARVASGLGAVGLLGPKIYPLDGTSAFTEITSGSANGSDGFSSKATNGAYAVGPNYNLVTGLGSPNVGNLIAVLAKATSGTAPVITTQPVSQTVAQGGTVTFTVAASGTPSPAFQWTVNGVAISDGPLPDDSIASGSGTATLTILNAQTTEPIAAAATNPAGTAISKVATLTVTLPLAPNATVTTLAGSGSAAALDGTGTAASFNAPGDVALDAAGNVYVADSNNNEIRRITSGGVVTTWAGATVAGSTDGTGTAASFNFPTGVAVDASGNVYVADSNNNKIRKVTSAGVVTTLAGSGSVGSTDGTGTAASFSFPTAPAVDTAGNVYVADSNNNKIRKVTPAGVVTTFAGSGTSGWTDGEGTAASFSNPAGVAVDTAGNLYVADAGNEEVRKITPAGVVTTLAGSALNGSGSANGSGAEASFSGPGDVAVDVAGNVYVADGGNNEIRRISPGGAVTNLAGSTASGSTDGAASAARFNNPQGVSVDSAGNVYVADQNNNKIRKIVIASSQQKKVPVITWATPANITDGAALSSSQLDATANVPGTFVYTPEAGTVLSAGTQTLTVTFTPTDTIDYTLASASQTLLVSAVTSAPVANSASDVIANRFTATWSAVTGAAGYRLNVSTNGSFTTFVSGFQNLDVGNVTSANVTGLNPNTTYYFQIVAYDSAGIGIASGTVTVTTTPAISISAPLAVSTLAGQALSFGSADGTGSAARFFYPSGLVATASSGNVYVADTDNETIRKVVAATGVVTTLAGSAGVSGSVNGAGSAALFNKPSGVAVDSAEDVYVADTLNNTIRMVTSSGVVTTIAGTPGVSGSLDGTGSSAQFRGPQGLAIDSANNLYVADTNNHTIRKVVPSTGKVTTIAGVAGSAGAVDGGAATALFNFPSGVAIDSTGNLYVADTDNDTIREVSPAGTVSTLAGLAGNSGGADGIGGAATFDSPSAVAVDSLGNVYVADTGNFTIRMIVPSTRATSTIAGIAGVSGSSDGSGSAALFFQPAGLAADSSGHLYIADTDNHTLRVGLLSAAPTIQTQPQSQTVNAGSSVQFSVTASGRPAPTYQWYFNGTMISGATGILYSLSNAQTANAGNYTVAVANALGSVTSNPASLTVNSTSTSGGGGSGSGGGGGGGAPSDWFILAAGLLGVAKWIFGKKPRTGSRGRQRAALG